jgi:hypothetical protein
MCDPGPIHTFSTQPRKRRETEEEEMHTPSSRAITACVVILGLILTSCSGAGSAVTALPGTASTSTAPDPQQSPDAASEPIDDAVSVVTAALMAWSDGDRPAFEERMAETAHWFGLPLDGEPGSRQFEFQWGYNTTLGANFADLECVDSGREDTISGGTIVECSGMFSDTRHEMLGANPAPFDAEYAVEGGQIVNAISFQAVPDEQAGAALDFIDAYLTGLGVEYGQACDPAGSTGTGCAEFMLSHLPRVVEAWNDELES